MSDTCVLGMGFVGIPLGLTFDSAGYDVVGFDIDEDRIRKLERGQDPTGELGEKIKESEVSFTTDPRTIQDCEYVIITVPTPVDGWNQPDLNAVTLSGQTVGENISEGTTVILESTVYPGATNEVLVPAIEEASGLTAGTDFSVGYSPERITPSESDQYSIRRMSKIVSGQDEETLADLVELYESVVDATVYPAATIETAEAAKCLENVQRDVNIALMNEFVMGCDQLDTNVRPQDVLLAAQTKPGFHDYHPGIVGGHCIPVDPHFLISKFEKNGFDAPLMRHARQTNESFPEFVAERTIQRLTSLESRYSGDELRGARRTEPGNTNANCWDPAVLILGFAYKANTNDTRNDALDRMIEELERYNTTVYGYDPNVEPGKIEEQFGVRSLEEPHLSEFDAIIITTLHDEFQDLNLEGAQLETDPPAVVDLTGHFRNETSRTVL